MLTESAIIKYVRSIKDLEGCAGVPKIGKQLVIAKDWLLGELEAMSHTPEGDKIINELPVPTKRELMRIYPLSNLTHESEADKQ